MKPWFDWVSMPEPFNWMTNQPNLQLDITAATIFGQRYAIWVAQLFLWEAWCEAIVKLCEVANLDEGLSCPADYATGMANPATCYALSLWQTLSRHEAALLGWATLPLDDQPCTWCGQDYNSPTMVLCNWCNHCYHRDYAV